MKKFGGTLQGLEEKCTDLFVFNWRRLDAHQLQKMALHSCMFDAIWLAFRGLSLVCPACHRRTAGTSSAGVLFGIRGVNDIHVQPWLQHLSLRPRSIVKTFGFSLIIYTATDPVTRDATCLYGYVRSSSRLNTNSVFPSLSIYVLVH